MVDFQHNKKKYEKYMKKMPNNAQNRMRFVMFILSLIFLYFNIWYKKNLKMICLTPSVGQM